MLRSSLCMWVFLFTAGVTLLHAQNTQAPLYFQPSGLPGIISDVSVHPVAEPKPLPKGAVSPDADLTLMAAWALRHLSRNPRPALDYEPVFQIWPMAVPPTPEGHDPIVPGDTDCRMDWEFIYMREMSGSREGLEVEKGLRRRILGYVEKDNLAWRTPGARMEGAVYRGEKVPEKKEAAPWTTSKIIRSLSETYARTGDAGSRELARNMFLALRKLATWDTGRAYYEGKGWRDGKWIVKAGRPTPAIEQLVRYWEATGDQEALEFAIALAEGLIASPELIHDVTSRARVEPTGEFKGHMHSTLHSIWGVAHLGVVTGKPRYVDWAKKAYDYASRFGTGTGWISAVVLPERVRLYSETCATSDMVSLASWIGKAGFPDYWDHVERTFRNYIRPFQFFVTPEYEAMYRKLNRDKPEEQVEAGLARMRDLQGGFIGGPAPNDRINWMRSPQRCGPYATPYGCIAMFGCCLAEGMRALYTTWSNIVTAEQNGIFVNLSLNRDSEWAQVISSLPEQGRIDVVAKKAGNYFLRPPSWAPRNQVRVARSGRELQAEWEGPARAYVIVKDVKPGEVLTLVYPLVSWKQAGVGNWPTKPDLKFTIFWKGNAVMDMDPKGKALAVNFANMSPAPPLP